MGVACRARGHGPNDPDARGPPPPRRGAHGHKVIVARQPRPARPSPLYWTVAAASLSSTVTLPVHCRLPQIARGCAVRAHNARSTLSRLPQTLRLKVIVARQSRRRRGRPDVGAGGEAPQVRRCRGDQEVLQPWRLFTVCTCSPRTRSPIERLSRFVAHPERGGATVGSSRPSETSRASFATTGSRAAVSAAASTLGSTALDRRSAPVCRHENRHLLARDSHAAFGRLVHDPLASAPPPETGTPPCRGLHRLPLAPDRAFLVVQARQRGCALKVLPQPCCTGSAADPAPYRSRQTLAQCGFTPGCCHRLALDARIPRAPRAARVTGGGSVIHLGSLSQMPIRIEPVFTPGLRISRVTGQ